MHDGLSFTREEAIARHAGQALGVRQTYDALSAADKRLLLKFLNSLWSKRLSPAGLSCPIAGTVFLVRFLLNRTA